MQKIASEDAAAAAGKQEQSDGEMLFKKKEKEVTASRVSIFSQFSFIIIIQ